MTLPQLEARIALLTRTGGKRDPSSGIDPAEERYQLAQKIVTDWVENATLALEAQQQGYKVTEEEIDAALAKISQESSTDMQEVSAHIGMIGIPQGQLREELRDGLLIEKFILDVVRSYDKSIYKKIFETEPMEFLVPPKAKVFHAFHALDRSMTSKQREKILDKLEDIRKEMKKKNPDYAALEKLSNPAEMLAVADMGWVSADGDTAHGMDKLLSVIFSLEPGQTSEVFTAGLGAHVVRVLEREEGSKFSFEGAMPQIENYLFEKTKHASYEALKTKYKIQMNTGGLTRWREAKPGEKRVIRTASASQRPATSAPKTALPAAKPMTLPKTAPPVVAPAPKAAAPAMTAPTSPQTTQPSLPKFVPPVTSPLKSAPPAMPAEDEPEIDLNSLAPAKPKANAPAPKPLQ